LPGTAGLVVPYRSLAAYHIVTIYVTKDMLQI